MYRASKVWLVAMVAAVNLTAGCQGALDDGDSYEAYCPQGGGEQVTFVNRTGRAIHELQIRSLDEAADPYAQVDLHTGLAIDGTVTWQRCTPEVQALVVTFSDGTVGETEIPTLTPSTRRLTLIPGAGDGPEDPPPATRRPVRLISDEAIPGIVPTTGR